MHDHLQAHREKAANETAEPTTPADVRAEDEEAHRG
jgi:hypothetical protein